MLGVFLKNERWEMCVPYFLVTALFFIPISSSLKSIFIVLSALAILLTPIYRRGLASVFTQHWCKAAIAFFLVALLACFWSSAEYHTRLLFVEKYSKLLYLPLFAVGFQNPKIRRIGIHVFLLAMTVTCIFSIFKNFSHVEASERLFHDHISTSCMMAFAAYLAGLLAARQSAIKRIVFLSLALLFSYQVIFINTGRIGYIIYFVLMMMLFIQTLPWKYIIIGIVGFGFVFALCSYQSTNLQSRLSQGITDWNQYQQGEKETSIGMRLVFHGYAKSMFLSSPWKGHGTGSFSHFYQQVNTAPAYSKIMEPHSQYWLVASEFGLLGLIVLICFFISLVVIAFQLHEMKPIMLGILTCFFISNISDSQLLHSDIGYLFVVFSALCLGELFESRRTHTIKVRKQNSSVLLKAVI